MRRKGFAAGLAAVLVLAFVLLAGAVPAVYADTPERKDFSGSVSFLRQEENRYVMQVTAANVGEDFSGTVRLVFTSGSPERCAYDTELTLPKGGQKQFTLTIPESSADRARGECVMSFLDEKGHVLQTLTLKNVFGSARSGVVVGILSDCYEDLTYLDLGGADFDMLRESAPITLVELDKDTLAAGLDGLYFLVIDRFDVASLGGENIRLIEDWVRNGGWMIIGTGAYGEQTLGGFDEDFLGLRAGAVSAPGEDNYLLELRRNGDYFWGYEDAGIEISNMAVTELEWISTGHGYLVSYLQNWEQPCMTAGIGDGAVGVYAVSLGDPELKKGYRSLYQDMLSLTMQQAQSYNNYYSGTDMNYLGRSALARIDNENTNVNFTWLMVLIGLYVVLAGPVLYLILRGFKKSGWYWAGVPLLGVAFIVLVFFFGKGIRLNEAKVYSVSVQRVDAGWQDTYYEAYRSGTRSWNMRLSEGYEVGGACFSENYGYYSTTMNGDYHYLVKKDSEGLSVGMKPEENFESGYLYAGGRTESAGEFDGKELYWNSAGLQGESIAGTVTNRTDEDLAYLALVAPDGGLLIFSDVKAGETLDLAREVDGARCIYCSLSGQDYYSLYYEMNGTWGSSAFRTATNPPMDEMMALFIGLGVTAGEELWSTQQGTPGVTGGTARLVGLVKDASPTVASRCDEKAYRCLYAYAPMKVESYWEMEVDEYVAD